MSIPKRNGINYREYLEDLIKEKRTHVYPDINNHSCNALREVERAEFAGYLLKDNSCEHEGAIFAQILNIFDNSDLSQLIIDYMINDQPENGTRILNYIKQAVIKFYEKEMQDCLDGEDITNHACDSEDIYCKL